MILTGVRALPDEEWRPVVGSEGMYLVSSLGRVYSIPRPGTRAGGLLKQPPDGKGYLMVCITIAATGRRKARKVHRLMGEAFLAGPHEGNFVRHLNDIKDDNRLDNLAWGTQGDNMQDAVRNGGHHNASKTHCKHGHEFTEKNTSITGRGSRRCLACDHARPRGSRAAS